MKLFLAFLVVLSSSAFSQTVGSSGGGFNNCSMSTSQGRVQVRLQIAKDTHNVKKLIEESRYFVNANSNVKWKYVSIDNSIEASIFNGDVVLELLAVDFLTLNQFGERSCRFNGSSAHLLFLTLFESTSSPVRRSPGINSKSHHVELGTLHCVDRMWGTDREIPECSFRP